MKSVILSILIVVTVFYAQAQTESNYILKNGDTVKLPLHYEGWTWIMATFTIPIEQAKSLLPDGLIPITFSKDKALISFGAYRYPRVSDLEPYDEFLVSIPVQYNQVSDKNAAKKYNPLFPHDIYNKNGSFIYYLPVTTEESFKAGSEIWGFPKVKRKMVFDENETTIKCLLYDQNTLEMTLEIDKIDISEKKSDFTYCAYTIKSDKLLRTCVNANGNYGVENFGINATITLDNGHISETLSKFEISNKPVQVFYAKNVSSELPLAQDQF